MGKNVEQSAEEQAAKFLDRARNFDFNSKDVTVAAVVAGLGLAAVAAYLAKKRLGDRAETVEGEKVSVARQPTQYMKGVTSVVRESGDAASFPMDEEAAVQHLGRDNDPGIFLIEGQDLVRSADRDPRYLRVARWAIGFAQQYLGSRPPEETGPAPDQES